jgi:hypothetical protein
MTLKMTGATMDEVRPLLQEFHYLGAKCADPMHVFAWRKEGGLFGDTGEPVAAVVYAAPANNYFGPGSVELVRLVRTDDMSEPLSRFVAWTLRWLKRQTDLKFCVSYADSSEGHHGGIYQALGFMFVRLSNGHGYWMNPETGERCSSRSFDQRRPQFREGWVRQKSGHKYCYVKALAEKSKHLRARFNWDSLAYPKPDLLKPLGQPADMS